MIKGSEKIYHVNIKQRKRAVPAVAQIKDPVLSLWQHGSDPWPNRMV